MAVSEAQKRATAKYEKENYDKVLVRFPKGTKERIESQSKSANAYIIQAVIERLEADEDESMQDVSMRVQNGGISHGMIGTDKSIDNGITSLTEPQNAPEKLHGFPHMPQDERKKWENVQSVEELQAMLAAKREDMKRQQEERDQAKADALEQERQENFSIMMSAIDNAMNAQKQREKSDEEELERMEENGDGFPKYSEENIKEVLRVNGSFREHVSSHVYKDAMIEKYGTSNYALFQKCLQDVESEEKEAKRKETIARAKTEINQ